MLVKKETTTPSREDFARALSEEWNCSLLTGAVLFGQFAFETGWGKYCYCWNLGNIRADKNWIENGLDYFELPGAWEIINGKRSVVGGYFRAHKSLNQGIKEHIEFLEKNSRYSQAFDVLIETKNIKFSKDNAKNYSTKFAIGLKRGGYFTGSLEEYIKGISSISSGLIIKEYQDEEETAGTIRETIKNEPNEWGPITLCQAFERIGIATTCSVTEE